MGLRRRPLAGSQRVQGIQTAFPQVAGGIRRLISVTGGKFLWPGRRQAKSSLALAAQRQEDKTVFLRIGLGPTARNTVDCKAVNLSVFNIHIITSKRP